MMEWQDVGRWIKENAGTGAGLVGSLLTGNLPGAVAAGVALVSSATGTTNPDEVLQSLQSNPDTVLKLKALALENEASIRGHIEEMTRLSLQDRQHQHQTTQETIRAGDRAEDRFVRWTRPAQAWLSMLVGAVYVYISPEPDVVILSMWLTLPWAYAGLRQVGKGVDAFANVFRAKADSKG